MTNFLQGAPRKRCCFLQGRKQQVQSDQYQLQPHQPQLLPHSYSLTSPSYSPSSSQSRGGGGDVFRWVQSVQLSRERSFVVLTEAVAKYLIFGKQTCFNDMVDVRMGGF